MTTLKDKLKNLGCRAGRDGECYWGSCPQNFDGEPHRSGRHCPRDVCECEHDHEDCDESCCSSSRDRDRSDEPGYVAKPAPPPRAPFGAEKKPKRVNAKDARIKVLETALRKAQEVIEVEVTNRLTRDWYLNVINVALGSKRFPTAHVFPLLGGKCLMPGCEESFIPKAVLSSPSVKP
jgi:hypothetical protein